jgi:tetratricopeptide (TPR) repeat protein
VTVTQNRASILFRMGEVRRSQVVGLEAMRRMQALRGGQPATPQFAVVYSVTLNRLGQTGEATDLLSAAREQAHTLGNEYWGALANYHLGRALMLAGKLDRAQNYLDEAERIWSANEVANRDRLADLSRTLAEIELARGHTDAARQQVDASLTRYGYPRETQVPGIAAALTAASRIHLKMGHADQAESLAREGLRITESIAREPRESADVGEALLMMAAAQSAKGNRADARRSIERAIEALSNGLGADHRLTQEAKALRNTITT